MLFNILRDKFYREVLNHPIRSDLEAAKAVSSGEDSLYYFGFFHAGETDVEALIVI
jgi:hypothetical protein